jgi:hypothetical protein
VPKGAPENHLLLGTACAPALQAITSQETIIPRRFWPGQGESWEHYGAGNDIPGKNCSWLTCPRGCFSWELSLGKYSAEEFFPGNPFSGLSSWESFHLGFSTWEELPPRKFFLARLYSQETACTEIPVGMISELLDPLNVGGKTV